MDHDNEFGDFDDAVAPVVPTKDKPSMMISKEETNDATDDLDHLDSTLTISIDRNYNNNKEEEEQEIEEEFGDFETAPTSPVMVPSLKEEIPVHIDHDIDGNFGQFEDHATTNTIGGSKCNNL
jgi:hypothetical protein